VTIDPNRVWRSVAAGFCGNLTHTLLMALKSWAHWLPGFNPYRDLQASLTAMLGTSVPAVVPWLLSYFNGAVVLGLVYGLIHRRIPGGNGAIKGAIYGIVGWVLIGLFFLPLHGKGLFGIGAGLGLAPALFTLLMVLTYSITLGIAYAVFDPDKR
jgi:uncharacterized protein DUF6789